jgi:hypothetical protein
VKVKLPRGATLPILGYYFRSKAYNRVIRKACNSRTYDILLLNDIWLGYGLNSLIKSKSRPRFVLAFMHDDSTLSIGKSQASMGRVLALRIRRTFERAVLQWLDLVLTNSDHLVQLMKKAYP